MSAGSSDGVAAADPVLRRWRNAVFVIFWLTGFLFASWATRVPNVRDILDASTSQMGVLIFGLAAGSVLGLFASSHVIARLGATDDDPALPVDGLARAGPGRAGRAPSYRVW